MNRVLTLKEGEILMITAQAANIEVSSELLSYEQLNEYPYYCLLETISNESSVLTRCRDINYKNIDQISFEDAVDQFKTIVNAKVDNNEEVIEETT